VEPVALYIRGELALLHGSTSRKKQYDNSPQVYDFGFYVSTQREYKQTATQWISQKGGYMSTQAPKPLTLGYRRSGFPQE